MDIATVVGVILALGLIVTSIVTSGGGITAFIDLTSLMVVIGIISAVMISFPLKNFLSVFSVTLKDFSCKLEPVPDIIQ
jgi:chemotaxis protein MotA